MLRKLLRIRCFPGFDLNERPLFMNDSRQASASPAARQLLLGLAAGDPLPPTRPWAENRLDRMEPAERPASDPLPAEPGTAPPGQERFGCGSESAGRPDQFAVPTVAACIQLKCLEPTLERFQGTSFRLRESLRARTPPAEPALPHVGSGIAASGIRGERPAVYGRSGLASKCAQMAWPAKVARNGTP